MGVQGQSLLEKAMVKNRLAMLLILVVLIASYWREVVFLQLNALIDNEDWNYSNTAAFDIFRQQPKKTLLQLKWLLTSIFSFLIGGSTFLVIKLMTFNNWIKRMINVIFAMLTILVGILGSLYLFTTKKELFYPPLRMIMGLFQTPLLLIIFGIIIYAINHLSELQNPKN